MLKDFFLNKTVILCIFIAVVLILGIIIIKLLSKNLKRILLQSPLDNSLITFILSGLSIILYLVLACIILGIIGISPTIIFSMISACGVAIGLALKDSLSNVANGLIIVSTKPFQTGDFVEIGSFEGTVKEIGIIRTELVTGDNKRVVLSNNTVIQEGIINYSSNQTRRVDLLISVSYDTNIDKAKEAIIKGCKKTNNYLVANGIFCEFAVMNASSLDFKVRLWCLNPNYWNVYYEALRNIYEELVDANIEIPYNKMDINIMGGNKNE